MTQMTQTTQTTQTVETVDEEQLTQLILIEARRLLNRPWGWVKGHFSTTRRRRATATDIHCYCAIGAIREAAHNLKVSAKSQSKAATLLDEVAFARGYSSVMAFNDKKTTKKRDVISLFDEAIAALTK